ncbi:PepSY-associated TM helix domain-containing protein [Sphingomonas sp.]|uniref:PepSY-associated TM helix domain-containing protein n=1 Tax=Sphingomonas sp. TaxID=28214 RepID=UPI0035C866A8
MSAAKSERPRGWPLSPAIVRAVLSGHGLLGLAFAAIIYLVCLSGTLAVFVHDLERWEQPTAPRIERLDDVALDRAVQGARETAPADAMLFVSIPKPDEPGAGIVAYTPSFEREWSIATDGTLVEHLAPFAAFVMDLHIALHLPRTWGEFIVGLAGVALLSSLVSGLLAHPRVFKDAFHLRLGGSRRLQEADLHNRLGIWALPFHVTIALTGALLGLSTIIVGVLALLLYRGDTARVYNLFLTPPPPVNAAAAPLPPIGAVLAEARRRAPGAVPHLLTIERAGRADARFTVSSERERLLVAQDTTVFDAAGRVVKDDHPRDLSVGTRILGGVGQLHFGWFGGVPVRIAYGLLGLALCVVTSSGVTVWLARRRDKGRAVPQWERLWTAVAWGQPLIVALVALLALAGGGAVLVWAWVAATIVLLVAAGISGVPAMAAARALRLALGATMVLVALVHAIRFPPEVTGMVVDVVVLAGGAWLAWRNRQPFAAVTGTAAPERSGAAA